MDYEEFKEALDMMGIQRGRGPQAGFTLIVPCLKPGRDTAFRHTIAAIQEDGGYYNVISLALPYFHGPAWREITGGKPLCMRCNTWQDVLTYMMQEFGNRWRNGALLVDEW